MTSRLLDWELVAWDTEFFSMRTARVQVTRLEAERFWAMLDEMAASAIEMIHCLVESDHDLSVCLLEQAGFHLVDLRVTLTWTVLPVSRAQPPEGLTIRPLIRSDIIPLQQIARSSYQLSRYYYDAHYDRERCDAMYGEWLVRSAHGEAEHTVVIERSGTPLGFVTCHQAPGQRHGRIGLVGIHPILRGQGTGQHLLQAAQSWFVDQQAEQVSVVTQGRNIAAQRLYQRCGFLTSNIQLWYHKKTSTVVGAVE